MNFKPWLALPARLAHELTPLGLPLISRLCTAKTEKSLEFKWRGLTFKNRLGISGGVDKNAKSTLDWQRLGAGFIEIGTVTPEPQGPNPGRIIGRDNSTQALWNKMGFPNDGILRIVPRLEKVKDKLQVPVFVNVGKNRLTTPEKSYLDYAQGIKAFRHVADVFVLNISSPNTKGLRGLQNSSHLKQFLDELFAEIAKTCGKIDQPFLIKFSPDMTDDDFLGSLAIAKQYVQGFILTNTTTDRTKTPFFPEEGGMSGAPLRERAEHVLRLTIDALGNERQNFLIVSCGGIVHPDDAVKRLQLGSDLIQTYSGLIFHGPCFFQDCCKQLKMV